MKLTLKLEKEFRRGGLESREKSITKGGRGENDPLVQRPKYRSVKPEKGVPQYSQWQLKIFPKKKLGITSGIIKD